MDEEVFREMMRPFDPEEDNQGGTMDNPARDDPSDNGHEEEAGEEAVQPSVRVSPKQPSTAEVESHMVTHLPFREWCPHCVKGKSKSKPHQVSDAVHEMPTLTMDYMFMHGSQRAGTEEGMPRLVTRDLTKTREAQV